MASKWPRDEALEPKRSVARQQFGLDVAPRLQSKVQLRYKKAIIMAFDSSNSDQSDHWSDSSDDEEALADALTAAGSSSTKFHHLSDQDRQPQDLLIKAFTTAVQTDLRLNLGAWATNDLCWAKFAEDGLDYEAVVLEVNPVELTCRVRYRDNLKEARVQFQDLKPMSGFQKSKRIKRE